MPTNETMDVGQQLATLCREEKRIEAIEQLYSPDIVSVEAAGSTMFDQTMAGIDQIKAKNVAWAEANEVHSAKIDGPYPHGDRFILFMKYEVTPTAGPMLGNRMVMQEMGLYTVSGGKITKEEFFYDMG